MLHARRDTFERVRTLWSEKRGIWCALDLEAWDRDHHMITEFGWSLVRWENDQDIWEKGHLIVKEYRSYTNTYVANNKEVFFILSISNLEPLMSLLEIQFRRE
jgi:hypothetical protein